MRDVDIAEVACSSHAEPTGEKVHQIAEIVGDAFGRAMARAAWLVRRRLRSWRRLDSLMRFLAILVALMLIASCSYIPMQPKSGDRPTPYAPRLP